MNYQANLELSKSQEPVTAIKWKAKGLKQPSFTTLDKQISHLFVIPIAQISRNQKTCRAYEVSSIGYNIRNTGKQIFAKYADKV